MKIIITENKLDTILKKSGVLNTVKILGGWENFRKAFNIQSYEEYLHLFDDLDEVQSTDIPKYRLYRHKPGENIIIYNTEEKRVGIIDNEILSVLEHDMLGLSPEIDSTMVKNTLQLIQKWLGEVYNIDIPINRIHRMFSWDDITHIN